MSMFSGLGRGFGKAAIGYQSGGIAAEKENYRRGQIETDREQKKQLLALKKKEGDPDEKVRQFAGQQALQNQSKMADPANRAYFLTPEGAAHFKRLQDQNHVLLGIRFGLINPRDADPYMLSWSPEPGAAEADPQEEALAAVPGLQMPGSRMAPPLGDMGGPEPGHMPDVWGSGQTRGAMIPHDAPPSAPLPPRIGPPDIGPAPPKPKAPPPPPDPLALYMDAVNNPPKKVAAPGERPQDTDRRFAQEMAAHDRRTGLLLQAAQAADILRQRKAAADKAGTDAHYAPTFNEQKRKGNTAGTELKQSQTVLNKALTPVKVKQGQLTAKKTEQDVRLAPQRLRVQEQAQGETARHNRAMEQQNAREFDDRRSRADRALTTKSGSKAMDAIKTQLKEQLSRYKAKHKMASGSDVFDEPPEVREKIGKEIDRLIGRLREVEKNDGPTRVTTTTRTGGGGRTTSSIRTGVLGKGAVQAAAPGKKTRSELLASAKRYKMDKATTAAFLKANGY